MGKSKKNKGLKPKEDLKTKDDSKQPKAKQPKHGKNAKKK